MNVADFIQIALLVLVCVQIYQTNKTFKADHERQRKQATFEFINAVSDRFRSALNIFDDKHGIGRVVDIQDYDDEDKFTVKSYLNEIERICAGVNAGVFDYEILKKMMRGNLIKNNERFRQYITNSRSLPNSQRLFIEFDNVVNRLKSESDYDNIGKIEHS